MTTGIPYVVTRGRKGGLHDHRRGAPRLAERRGRGPAMIAVVGIGVGGICRRVRARWCSRRRCSSAAPGSSRCSLSVGVERIDIVGRMGELKTMLRERTDRRCVVIASGNPLFYGIGTTVLRHFPRYDNPDRPLLRRRGLRAGAPALARRGADLNPRAPDGRHRRRPGPHGQGGGADRGRQQRRGGGAAARRTRRHGARLRVPRDGRRAGADSADRGARDARSP